MPKHRRSTPQGEHRPVLLEQVLEVLQPQPGEVAVDCTVGWAGHAAELLGVVGETGRLIGLDLDEENLHRARIPLTARGTSFALHHANFAGLPAILAGHRLDSADMVLADLGMSSMQVDDPERGFSYTRDGPLDMRMDRSRGKTAAELLATVSIGELARLLLDVGDEPNAEQIATAIGEARRTVRLTRTSQLARLIQDVAEADKKGMPWRVHPGRNRWNTHPAARTFQVLRILVNRELANLERLLQVLPEVLGQGGRAAIISFHSGEDRLVKSAFRAGMQCGRYSAIAEEPIRASLAEKIANPRSRSAKLRWARRSYAQ